MAPNPKVIATIPDVSDLTAHFPPVYDQGDFGSCTGNGWAGAFDAQRHAQGMSFMMPARMFIYGEERKMEGDFAEDAGAQVRTGAKVLAKFGAPPEAMFPYTPADFTAPYSHALLAESKKHLVVRYERVAATLPALCAELAAGFAVVMGFTVFDSFESDAVAANGILSMPGKDEKNLGGHCTVFVGHKITNRAPATNAPVDGVFKVRNSWGADWGQGGYFTMPFGYVTKGLVSDCWAIRTTMG
jgi:C1A family cysteine protease